MTELERQLTTALRRLSEQYAREQRQQTERVEALQRRVKTSRLQIEQLAGQVTREVSTIAVCECS